MKSIIEKIFKPLEIYALSLAFVFTNLFDKNLTIENVDDTPVRGLLLNLRSFLDIFLDTEGFIGSYVLVIQFIIIVWIGFFFWIMMIFIITSILSQWYAMLIIISKKCANYS